MIRHDLQQDLHEAHKATVLAREHSTQSPVLDELKIAHDRIHDIAEKLGVDLKIGGY